MEEDVSGVEVAVVVVVGCCCWIPYTMVEVGRGRVLPLLLAATTTALEDALGATVAVEVAEDPASSEVPVERLCICS